VERLICGRSGTRARAPPIAYCLFTLRGDSSPPYSDANSRCGQKNGRVRMISKTEANVVIAGTGIVGRDRRADAGCGSVSVDARSGATHRSRAHHRELSQHALWRSARCSSTLNGLSLGAVVIPMAAVFRRMRLISMSPNKISSLSRLSHRFSDLQRLQHMLRVICNCTN
jgi:hypothetical protein